jgi:hypothetical protein
MDMKTELTAENLDAFRERFGTFHDAVIHSVEYGLFSNQLSPQKPTIVTITVGMRDWQIKSENKWINLTFYVEQVQEMILQKSRNYALGIIFNLSLAFFEDEIYLDFYPSTMKPISPEDFRESSIGSMLLVIGKRCFWSVEDYQERENVVL